MAVSDLLSGLDQAEVSMKYETTKAPSRKLKKNITKDDDLFNDDTDIFADLPSAKPKEKKTTSSKVSTKPLFKEDIDDIFADSLLGKKKENVASKKGGVTRKNDKVTSGHSISSIFGGDEEEEGCLFDDPLSIKKK